MGLTTLLSTLHIQWCLSPDWLKRVSCKSKSMVLYGNIKKRQRKAFQQGFTADKGQCRKYGYHLENNFSVWDNWIMSLLFYSRGREGTWELSCFREVTWSRVNVTGVFLPMCTASRRGVCNNEKLWWWLLFNLLIYLSRYFDNWQRMWVKSFCFR